MNQIAMAKQLSDINSIRLQSEIPSKSYTNCTTGSRTTKSANMSQKKYYMDVINLLAPLSIFAGSLTIATQFLIPCSEPSLASLLALASQLFLGSLAGLLIVFLLLYGFWDTDIIHDGPKPGRCCGRHWGRHSLVVAQIVVLGLMMVAAFMVLGVAIIVVGNHRARGLGMALVFLVFLGALLVGVMIGRNKYVRVQGCLPGPLDPVPVHDVERDLTRWQSLALAWLILLELVIVAILIGLGTWQAVDPPARLCDVDSLSVQWPSSTFAFSEVNVQTNYPVSFTDVDTVLSITFEDIQIATTQASSWSTITSIKLQTITISDRTTSSSFITLSLSTRSLDSYLPLTATIKTSCFTCPPFRTPPPSLTTFTITSTTLCTAKGLFDEWARRARPNLPL